MFVLRCRCAVQLRRDLQPNSQRNSEFCVPLTLLVRIALAPSQAHVSSLGCEPSKGKRHLRSHRFEGLQSVRRTGLGRQRMRTASRFEGRGRASKLALALSSRLQIWSQADVARPVGTPSTTDAYQRVCFGEEPW